MEPCPEDGFAQAVVEQARVLADYVRKYPDFFESQKEVLERLYDLIEGCRAIHTYGKGRSSNSAISLSLRLKHFGYNVWFVGDVVKERIKKGDLIILFSGSGETSEVIDVAKRAKKEGADVFSVSSYKESSLGRYSDLVFVLPGGLEKKKGWEYLEAQLGPGEAEEPLFYGGGEFETMAYLFQETLVSGLGKFKKIPSCVVFQEHERDEVLGDD